MLLLQQSSAAAIQYGFDIAGHNPPYRRINVLAGGLISVCDVLDNC
ncbi:hypothetical protein [Bacillus cereus]